MSNRLGCFRIVLGMGMLLALACAGQMPSAGTGGATPAAGLAGAASTAPGKPALAPTMVRPNASPSGQKAAGFLALEQELKRAMSELGKGGGKDAGKSDAPPYFIGYQVHDHREVAIQASDGALVQSDDHRHRALSTDVRVGDYKLDSTHALRNSGFDFDFSSYMGNSAALPLDDSPAAIKAVAWAETDKRYKAALERLLKIKAQKQVKAAEEDQSDDFSREAPVTLIEPPAAITVDVPAWEARVRRLSARFRADPDVHDAQVSLQVTSDNTWITNSEGSSVQTGRNHVRVMMHAEARADDGMEQQRHEMFDAAAFAGLPDEAAMAKAADTIIADLRALRKAPLAEPYTGPAILEGKAAGVFFHEIFGHRVEGHRQKKEDEGQTFAKKIGEAVMPAFISVYDDPTISRIGGDDLNGFYRVDDEAVAAQRATLVDKGILRSFLMGRSPTRGFNKSNGHGRRQEGRNVVARQGNLVVEPAVSVPVDELRQHLRDEAKRQGKAFGLLFKDISGGFTNTGRFGPQAFKVLPILVYRVWVDGRPDELLRGADLVGTPLVSLSKILAAADDYQTFNGFCGAESGFVPVSATSPSLLVQQIEVERKEKGNEKPPVLPAPAALAAAAPGAADDGAVQRAMEDELKRATTELHMGDQPRPYFAAFTVADIDMLQIGATFGALTGDKRTRHRLLRSEIRVGDPGFDNSNFSGGGFDFSFLGGGGGAASLPIEDDYTALRREFWLRSDAAYKRALETLSKKKAAATSQAATEDDKVPDFAAQPTARTVSTPVIASPDPAPLRDSVVKLSALFQGFPAVATSRVNATAGVGRQRFLSSEGTWADERDGFVRVEVSCDTQAADGQRLKNRVSFTATSVAGLPPYAQMEKTVRQLADDLAAMKQAPQPDNGSAMVLFEGSAAAQIVKALMADHLGGTPPPKTSGNESSRRSTESEFAGKIGQKVAAPLLSAYDDPLAQTGPGKAFLFGHYQADDEGVPGQKVSLIEGGVLKALLMSRAPSKDIPKSNGHGRGGLLATAKGHIANLFVTAKGGLPRKALLDRMAKASKDGKTQAYVVRLVDDQTIASSGDMEEMMMFMFSSMNRGGGTPGVRPLIAYRLKDGKELPSRGFTLEGLLPKSLKDIVAAGKDPVAFNFVDGPGGSGAASSIVTPALLFSDVEVRKQTGRNKKPPLYPHPSFTSAAAR